MITIKDIFNGKPVLALPAIAGYSDDAMRFLAKKFGATLTFTEMVSAKGLYYKNENSNELLLTSPNEDITAVQIFGSDERIMAEVINYPELAKFDIIDVNFGCPVPKIVKNGEGSALLTDPNKIYKIIKSLKENANGRLVSGKIRLGFTSNLYTAVEAAQAIEAANGDFVTVHGRTRDMFYSGVCDLEGIKEVKANVKIPIIGNGDVTNRDSYLKMLDVTKVDGVAIARAAIGHPQIFEEVLGTYKNLDLKEMIFEHFELLKLTHDEHYVVNGIKRHIAYYLKGTKNSKIIKDEIYKARTFDELLNQMNYI